MIAVRIMGGLGNQMFQYAFGLALAKHYATDLYLDTLHMRTDTGIKVPRALELSVFPLNMHTLTRSKYHLFFKDHPNSFVQSTQKLYCKIFPHPVFKEHTACFDPIVLQKKMPHYFWGYWQSPMYFKEISEEIKKIYTLDLILSEETRSLQEEIKQNQSLCINFRRTDAVANNLTTQMTEKYYLNAIEHIKEKVKNLVGYIFSDDIEWCKKNVRLPLPINYVEHVHAGPMYSHYLQLMMNCKHFVIPNSTFAWWAAWLGKNPDKIVTVPDPWHINPKLKNNDICPQEWIKIALN